MSKPVKPQKCIERINTKIDFWQDHRRLDLSYIFYSASGVIPRIFKDMVPMSSYSRFHEHVGKSPSRGNLVLGQPLIGVIDRLTNHKFAELR